MPNLVICCDGTWNTPDQLDQGVPAPTNVVRLYNAVAEFDAQGAAQTTYYHPGVGTDGNWWDKAVGGGTGAGLDDNIMSAYQKLCYCYQPGDAIFLFGFSRGAYTVRSLAGFIGRCGLLQIAGLPPAEVWARIQTLLTSGYRRKTEQRKDWTAQGWKFHNKAGASIPIHFIGVWDTVGALGVPDDMALLNLLDNRERYTFHDTTLHPSVKRACHALAMDERRASFQPTLWSQPPKDTQLKQIWFPGVHSDVGGGYQNCGLANGALMWMIDEASTAGLNFDPNIVGQIKPDLYDTMHDSCDGVFNVLATQPRSVADMTTQRAMFHQSALDRQKIPPITQSPYRKARLLAPPTPLVVDISARLPWNEIGLWLNAGTTYTFSASGEWLDASIVCDPAGPVSNHFQPSELAYLAGTALGKLETWYGKLFNNSNANFYFTRRHENYPWFSLVGAIANSDGVDAKGILLKPETFLIGHGCTYTPKRSGYLYAYANDAWNCYGNNKGHVALTIQ
ncbi:hypothetical protein AN403_6148 [Pseudomonas fluorescens]|uniref:T6SS Phospholipase effector Tle1-like catalytic domain-containing protein n=1 Tax=Pseudomonas fluorescens TaxID=294 RepID=A0A0P8XN68_PSEFL|nr:DUF2235 domain-containing protein [Pseudomonas fluorescens]KPU61987.1 hypothetical protein AN403_6148 [Pseudomonas fluorescens]